MHKAINIVVAILILFFPTVAFAANYGEGVYGVANYGEGDTTSPSGGSIGYTDGYYTSTSVTLTASDGTDSESGINTSSRSLERSSATLSSDTCGSYSSFASITPSGTYPTFTDTTVASGNCYKYRYLVSDNGANQAIYTNTNVAKIDTSIPVAPSTPSTTTPTTSTSQTWSWGAVTDAISGIASYIWRTTGTAVATGTSLTTSAITSLTEGVYSFFVKAVDTAGNQGVESAAGTLTVTTPSPSSTPSTSSSNSSSQPADFVCSDAKPETPNLFQIDAKSTSAKLFFSPLSSTEKYLISYSTSASADQYGAEVTLARQGVQNYTVGDLSPNTTYYFKVRGQNGCMAGEWSNILKSTTGSKNATQVIKYYLGQLTTKAKKSLAKVKPKSSVEILYISESPKPSLSPLPSPTPVAKQPKKFCILWWCFNR